MDEFSGFRKKDAIDLGKKYMLNTKTNKVFDTGNDALLGQMYVKQNPEKFKEFETFLVPKNKLIPSVSIKWLEKWCKEHWVHHKPFGHKMRITDIDALLSAARKQTKEVK